MATMPDSSSIQPFPFPPNPAEKQGSFCVFIPRASAQEQPQRRQPDVTELVRIVEELREKESEMRAELLNQKLLQESATIVPVLENAISDKDLEIQWFIKKIECLEAENECLRDENELLHMELSRRNLKFEEKIQHMQAELADIKRVVAAEAKTSSPSTSMKLIDVTNSYQSMSRCRAQIVRNPIGTVTKDNFLDQLMENSETPRYSRSISGEIPEACDELLRLKSRVPRIPKPPPRPCSESTERPLSEISCTPSLPVKSTVPPAPPVPPALRLKMAPLPPPPPPPQAIGLKQANAMVSRVPEVVEFYHSLMRRDSNARREHSGGGGGGSPVTGVKDMIGEIENRSSHLLAIKTDVETQRDFIKFLIKEVEGAVFTDIEDVVRFVKWLDDELSYLVDERAVLKHFDWPENKADALREAAFGYSDLKKMESEASSFRDDPRLPCGRALKKMQSLLEKLEHGVYSLSRMRELATKRYKLFQIPINWMLETGFVSQIKLASVKLAMNYMKRVLVELEIVAGGPEEEELILQGVKFAFRVHQFACGLDVETMKVFQQLRNKSRSYNVCHNSPSSANAF